MCSAKHPCNVPVRITHVSTLPAVKDLLQLTCAKCYKKMPYSLLRTFFIYGFKVSKYMSRNRLCNPNPKISYINHQ